jgi:(p)ppGpp synthase/HD superfamily hydrolase
VEELRTHIREQQREQEREKAIKAETRSAERVLKEQDVQQTSTSQTHHPLGSSVRKDSSPIKVQSFRFLFLE